MIPARLPAHLVQDPDGNWVVVGTQPKSEFPPPPLNTKLRKIRRPETRSRCLGVPVRDTRLIPSPAGLAQVLVRTPGGTATAGGATYHRPAQLPGPSEVPGAPGPMPALARRSAIPGTSGNPVPLQVGAAPRPLLDQHHGGCDTGLSGQVATHG